MLRRSILLGLSALTLLACSSPYPEPSPSPTPSQTPTPGQGPRGATLKTSRVNLQGAALAPQELDEWCWAATVSNVFAYHGHPVPQAAIVERLFGAPSDTRSGPYADVAALLNTSWVDANGRPFTSRVTGVYDAMAGVSFRVTNDTIRDALERNAPLFIGTTEHAMLVVSMTYWESNGHVVQVEEVDVFDPWPGRGLRPLAPAEATLATNGGALMFIAEVDVSG